MKDKLSIKDWSADDRPREKLLAKGLSSLSNAELIAILIGSGSRTESAVELSKHILRDVDNSLDKLGRCSIQYLQKNYNGIGEAKAISIVAALELGRRRKDSDQSKKVKITCSEDIYDLMHSRLIDLPHEEFWILLLDRANNVLTTQRISQGGLNYSSVDVRIIMRSALENIACSMALCHNHPSGTCKPSPADDEVTHKIVEAAKLLDITVLDHVIVAGDKHYSYCDEGQLR